MRRRKTRFLAQSWGGPAGAVLDEFKRKHWGEGPQSFLLNSSSMAPATQAPGDGGGGGVKRIGTTVGNQRKLP